MPAATIGLLAMFARSVDWSEAWNAIAHADPAFVALATVANLASLVVKGVRWWIFLRAVGISGMGPAVRATFAGAALNNVLVANGGDAARVAVMARRTNISSAAVLATFAIDRLCDLVTYAALFVAAAFALRLPPELARWRTSGLVVLALIGAIVVWLVIRRPAPVPAGRPASVSDHESFLSRARGYWRRLVSSAAQVATVPRVAIAIGLAFIAWAGQWATFHAAARSAAFAITPAGSLLALLAVNASFLVRLTPGNVGVFQVLYALAATSIGLDKDSAVAVSFLITLVQYIPVTLIGLLLARSLALPERGRSVSTMLPPTSFPDDPSPRMRGEQRRRT